MKTRTKAQASRRNHDNHSGGVRRSLKPALYVLLVVKLYTLFHTLALL